MPIEFTQQPSGGSSHVTRLVMMYDGSGRRISKTLLTRAGDSQGWDTTLVTHYTGIGTEVREYKSRNSVRYTDSAGVEHCVSANPDYGGNASTACPLPDTVRVAVPLPQGLGRYALQDADRQAEEGSPQAFEWYLKNHLGSTMVVYGTGFSDPLGISPEGELRAVYDYRSFGEQLDLLLFTRKVTENFTGKELDDEIALDYFGARYLDPMLGLWISVDPKRQFSSPYLYAGNGMNPVNVIDPDGNWGWLAWIFIGTGTIIGVNSCMNTMDEGLDWSANAAQTYGRTTVDGPVSQEQLHATNESARDFMKDTFLGVFSLGSSGAGSNKLIESAGNILHAIQNWFTDKKTAPPEPPQPESPPLEQNFNEKN